MKLDSQTCSICQCPISAGEDTTKCSQCGLPFHLDCWNENLGCSAYGCSNVNLLKGGPDISIRNPPPLGAPRGVPRWPSQTRSSNPTAPHPALAGADAFPWEYLLLAGCALASLLGALLYGVFALLAGLGCIVFTVARMNNSQQIRMDIMTICFVVSGIGFIFGIILSILFWW